MIGPTLIIVHRLSNRIRFKLNLPLKDSKIAVEKIESKKGINKVTYNPITKSLLIEFNEFSISMEEVIITVATVYSIEYKMMQVKLMGNMPTRVDMPRLAKYSIIAILGAAIGRIFVTNKKIQEMLNWIAVSTTIGATIEHAYSELNTKGAFDPEVVSVMYLMNSVRSGNFIQSSIITWFTTFGRHIINPSYDKAIIRINKSHNLSSGEVYYTASVSPHQDISKQVNFIREFISKSIEQEKNYDNNLLLLKDSSTRSYKNRFGGCRRISFS